MKTRFIKVDSIADVDASKITIHDLNNRYIDKQGNMYGLRYNRTSRKVEILKIIRTPVKSADYYHHKLRQQKKNGVAARAEKGYFENEEEMEVVEEMPSDDEAAGGQTSAEFNPVIFMDGTIELMQTHISRMNGIMNNIRNSRAIPDGDRMAASQMEDIFRNINIDGIQRIEKILAVHKELKEYPRSISYYMAKQNTKSRNIIDQLDTDAAKMEYIFFAELYYSIANLYRTLMKILKDLNYFLENVHVEDVKDLTFSEKQSFQDACISVENTIKECDRLLKDMKRIEDYLSDAKNF